MSLMDVNALGGTTVTTPENTAPKPLPGEGGGTETTSRSGKAAKSAASAGRGVGPRTAPEVNETTTPSASATSPLAEGTPGSAPAGTRTPEGLMHFHPLCQVFPMMGNDEFGALADDIAKNGLREDITIRDGKILDGRQRYIGCLFSRVKPRFVEFSGDDPASFVISKNLHRRDLKPGQRAVAAYTLLPHLEEEAAKRQHAGKGADGSGGRGKRRSRNLVERIPQGSEAEDGAAPAADAETVNGRARDQAAAMFGVNSHYITDLKMIQDEAPDEICAIKRGAKTIPQVMRELKRAQNNDEPKLLPKAVDKEVASLKGETFEIVAAEFCDLADWASQHSWRTVASLLTAVTKPDSVLFVKCGLQSSSPQTIGKFHLLTWLVMERAHSWEYEPFNMTVIQIARKESAFGGKPRLFKLGIESLCTV